MFNNLLKINLIYQKFPQVNSLLLTTNSINRIEKISPPQCVHYKSLFFLHSLYYHHFLWMLSSTS